MNRKDFLSILEANLSEYPDSSVNAVLNKYVDIFIDRESKGISDEETIRELGDPYIIATECKVSMKILPEESSEEDIFYKDMSSSSRTINLSFWPRLKAYWQDFFGKVFKFLSFIFFLMLTSPLFVILISLLIPAIMVCMFGVAIVFGVLILPRYVVFPLGLTSGAFFFLALGTLALGAVVFILGILLFRLTLQLLKKLGRKLGNILKGKEAF